MEEGMEKGETECLKNSLDVCLLKALYSQWRWYWTNSRGIKLEEVAKGLEGSGWSRAWEETKGEGQLHSKFK